MVKPTALHPMVSISNQIGALATGPVFLDEGSKKFFPLLIIFLVVNLFEPFNGLVFYVASSIFYLLLIAHLVECIIFRNKILKSPDSPLVAFSMTLIFGVIYLGSIKES